MMTLARFMILVFALAALAVGTTFAIVVFGGFRGYEAGAVSVAVLLVLALILRFWRR